MPSDRTPKSMHVRPHAVTSANIAEQGMYPSNALHVEGSVGSVAKTDPSGDNR